MDSIDFAAGLVSKVGSWVFNRYPMVVSALLTTLLPPIGLISVLANSEANDGEAVGFLLLLTLVLTPLGGFALWKTNFFRVPRSSWDDTTKAVAYASLIVGMLIAILIIFAFIFTVLILKTAVAAVGGSMGGGRRR